MQVNRIALGATALVALSCAATGAFATDADTFKTIAVNAAIEDDAPDVSVSIVPIEVADEAAFADNTLSIGDRIGFELNGVAGASVYILDMDTTGVVRMIFPNNFDDKNEPGEADTLSIPSEGAGYTFDVTGDPGTELVKVLVVRGDYSSLEDMLYEYFNKQDEFPKALVPMKEIADSISDFAIEHGETKFTEATIELTIQ